MRDLPMQGLLQQTHARKIGGEDLEVFGKKAAAVWASGHAKTLNEAVVGTVKEAGLSPEQVKRVVEFANTNAFLQEFRKEGAPHHVVDFGAGGPANPATVLQDLNDGGGGTVFDPGNGDYRSPPREKAASVHAEEAFEQMFKTAGFEYPEVNPLGDAIDLRDKLGAAYESATSTLSSLENMYADLDEKLFHHVKQAALEGHSLSEVAQIWADLAPSEEYVKVAFASLYDRLVDNGVFRTHLDLVASLEKNASVGVVNPEHPIVSDFKEFCETIDKLADVREDQQAYGEGFARLTAFLKEAAEATPKGVLQHAADAVGWAANRSGEVGEHVGKWLHSKGGGTGKFVGKYVVPAVAAHEVYRRTLGNSPLFHKAKNVLMTATPGTPQYQQKQLELDMQSQGYMPGMY